MCLNIEDHAAKNTTHNLSLREGGFAGPHYAAEAGCRMLAFGRWDDATGDEPCAWGGMFRTEEFCWGSYLSSDPALLFLVVIALACPWGIFEI